ncbi:MAG TPA: DapH/DapD/GlmU-related protein [Chloroflexota bacterium]|nr:DapH/DapD/GlmU-related protein [Chloroflexota bacterium]
MPSHGSGAFTLDQFRRLGHNVVFEPGVLVFHPENIEIGDNVYVGHNTILKGYFKNSMVIGAGTWIGQQCFLHSAGGITIGANAGIGPAVRIITSSHADEGRAVPVLHSAVEFAPVTIEDDSDLGVGSIVLPGIRVGRGAIVGAGAVVTRSVPAYAIVAGTPARILRYRPGSEDGGHNGD